MPTHSSTTAKSPDFTGYGALHSRYYGVRYSQDAVSQGCNMWTFLFDLMPRQRRCPPVVAVYHDRSNLLHTDASRYQTKSARNNFAVHPRSHTQTHPRPTIHTPMHSAPRGGKYCFFISIFFKLNKAILKLNTLLFHNLKEF